MLTLRGKGMLATALCAWLLSRILGVPELAMAALAMIALVVLAAGYTLTTSVRLAATRRVHPRRLFFDAEGTVDVTVRNAGRLPTAILQAQDRAPAGVAEDARFVVAPVPPGAAVTLRYALHGRHRGRYVLGPLGVRLRDPFGLTARLADLGGTDEVVVYPPVWRLPAGVPLAGHTTSGGEGRPRPLPSGEELANVREYVRGDDLRKVHWRTTAHRGKLMVRQEESPQNPQAVVVLDVRAGVHRGTGPYASIETAVAAAASATFHLAERAYRVVLLDRPMSAPPRALPWELVLDRLAVVRPDRRVELEGLWQQLGQGIGGEGVLCAVIAVPEPSELRRLVRAGRAFTTRLAVVVDTASFGGTRPGVPPGAARVGAAGSPNGSSRARRRGGAGTPGTVDALRAAGWRVTVVGAGDRLDERWRELVVADRRTAAGAPRVT